MVSPIQTWHHQEPKGLWPALGGMALLAHVGVVGLSLPYVLQMMQPAGKSTTATIPIELIEVEATPQLTSQANTPSNLTEEATKTRPQASTQSSELTNDSPTTIAAPSSGTANHRSTKTPERNSIATEAPAEATSQTPDAEAASSPANTPPDNAETNESESPSIETPETEPAETEPAETETETPETETPETESTVPPVLPGEQSLPTPGRESTGSDRQEVAYISLLSHAQVPAELLTDTFADTPPSPRYELNNGLELTPAAVGCEPLTFVQPQTTYRVTVNTNGTLRSAMPWTGSIEQRQVADLSQEEQAIRCLILSAGFSFNPAIAEGTPIISDNLLLTISIVESQ